MKHRLHWLAAAVSLLALAGAATATTVTFATFSDPSASSDNAMFTMAPDFSSLSGSWMGPGLSLVVPFANQIYHDVQFQLHGADPTQPGYIEFTNAAGPILRVAYTSASLTEFGFGSRDTTANPGKVELTYYPWGASFNPSSESFSFSFTNFGEDNQGNTTASAAFTSSASTPEPTTVVFLALGCVAVMLRRH